PAAVRSFHAAATDADDHAFDRDLRLDFSLLDGGLNARAEGLRIGDAAFTPTDGFDFTAAEQSQARVFKQADDAARRGASSVETDGELRFSRHSRPRRP